MPNSDFKFHLIFLWTFDDRTVLNIHVELLDDLTLNIHIKLMIDLKLGCMETYKKKMYNRCRCNYTISLNFMTIISLKKDNYLDYNTLFIKRLFHSLIGNTFWTYTRNCFS
jgi:hypothetical protein